MANPIEINVSKWRLPPQPYFNNVTPSLSDIARNKSVWAHGLGKWFIAIPWSDVPYTQPIPYTIIESSDGITWDGVSTVGIGGIQFSIVWSEDLGFLCAGWPATDGTNNPPSDPDFQNPVKSAISADGTTWTRSSQTGAVSPTGWSSSLSQFNAGLLYSNNGLDWTEGNRPDPDISNFNWSDVTWDSGHSRWVAVSVNTYALPDPGSVATSDDGINWTIQFSLTRHDEIPRFIAYSSDLDQLLFITSRTYYDSPTSSWVYENYVYTSTDGGSTWTDNGQFNGNNNAVGAEFPRPCWFGERGLWILGNAFGRIFTSADGVNWNQDTDISSTPWEGYSGYNTVDEIRWSPDLHQLIVIGSALNSYSSTYYLGVYDLNRQADGIETAGWVSPSCLVNDPIEPGSSSYTSAFCASEGTFDPPTEENPSLLTTSSFVG